MLTCVGCSDNHVKRSAINRLATLAIANLQRMSCDTDVFRRDQVVLGKRLHGRTTR